ncbi:sugar phosphate isomerase/epimerase family protein [Vallitalea okinawensis]|uniref:sugar phosphate isomerase/epimerase family protein n=1 Tax=Vallitalea okinawensis TaxID=2078660 RepID=UPI000CFCA431|nr:sugar phosphate isomerase/epimerase [Vallitalea okinawensis]
MSLSIGVQLYTLRDEMEKDFKGTLEKVKELGYEGVEFAGLFGKEGKEVKEILKDLSLKAVSAHVPLAELLKDPDKVLKTYKDIGLEYIAIPYLPEEDRPHAGNFDHTLKNIAFACEKAKEYGLTMLYHNHDFEFDVVDGEYYLDTIYKTISADLLQAEIDTCWVNVAGLDPSEYIMKYKDRAPVVHLKDFVMKGRAKKENLYELIGIDKNAQQSKEEFAFRPVGYGFQDFKQIIEASKQAGAKWVIVEQDRPATGQSPLESVELSIQYLKGLRL